MKSKTMPRFRLRQSLNVCHPTKPTFVVKLSCCVLLFGAFSAALWGAGSEPLSVRDVLEGRASGSASDLVELVTLVGALSWEPHASNTGVRAYLQDATGGIALSGHDNALPLARFERGDVVNV